VDGLLIFFLKNIAHPLTEYIIFLVMCGWGFARSKSGRAGVGHLFYRFRAGERGGGK
jgi:hypothetical protein